MPNYASSTDILDVPAVILLFLLAAISLCLTRFFAPAIKSPPALFLAPAALTPPIDRLATPAPMLDLVRDFALGVAPAGVNPPPVFPAARCAPSLAMTRDREIRGFRPMGALGFGGTVTAAPPESPAPAPSAPKSAVPADVKLDFWIG
ncbi:hypothetical protein EUX98_g5091 [Antrodiella citrinella]|uniref:Uncharacterized protein n=1 Tax=Antrodiella citrinella TaxID=2447956 RepID=A0A4S4MUW0_9APHY|nr:hypothetical protein EUX98_g5091 [Antrodiella citrinella]